MSSQLPAIRSAVRPFLEKMEAGDRIVVAVSGGADSLALAYALSMEVKKLAIQLSAVTIDHQLQSKSGEQASRVVEQMKQLEIDCTVVKVKVEITEGLEASARKARYVALDQLQADAIFLGHTHNDQAESVLLGLARGSGTRAGPVRRQCLQWRRCPVSGVTRRHPAAVPACRRVRRARQSAAGRPLQNIPDNF